MLTKNRTLIRDTENSKELQEKQDRETKIQVKVKFPYIITLMINRWMLRLVVRGTRWIKTVENLLRWDDSSASH